MNTETTTLKQTQNSEAGKTTNGTLKKGSFFNGLNSTKSINPWGVLVLVSTFILMIGSVFLVFDLQNDFAQFREERVNSTYGLIFLTVATVLFVFKAGFFIYNLYLYFRYKAIKSVSNEELPTCTVIVPAYNEGKQVWDTLMSLADSDYPEGKLEILAIDDGSKDDTWYWMQQAKRKLGDRLSICQ